MVARKRHRELEQLRRRAHVTVGKGPTGSVGNCGEVDGDIGRCCLP
jgi:hypothetical protein